ncbi:hypothetical protein CSA37_04950 [Candidatus Fermentibacteria bacterium]|nr:MAG: hypothetical protein CSA37_10240 [Candidatus Fermentibacteria bacterium]PIE52276.1 MAG: hypothetical protein CSA37_07345 [Candidatus Fermentibacteria bacterium]PIE52771.1 MAG: hypothetical protein CSA37_04950 [Candidatus Fermentibacteria bacterium]
MLHGRSTGFWIFISLAGMITGTVMGEAVCALLPDSSVALRQFFGGSAEISIGPLGFDLYIIRFQLSEIAVRLNIMTFAGLAVTGVLYKWF